MISFFPSDCFISFRHIEGRDGWLLLWSEYGDAANRIPGSALFLWTDYTLCDDKWNNKINGKRGGNGDVKLIYTLGGKNIWKVKPLE